MGFQEQFKTVDLLLNSTCETRGVDAFTLAVIKAERQIRRIFTHLIYQSSAFSESDIPRLKEVLASNRGVYFEGFINGFNALYPRTLEEIYGEEYQLSLSAMIESVEYRNKLFHGQLTGTHLTRKDLYDIIYNIKQWCSTLAKKTSEELGYDGVARNSYQKSSMPDKFSNVKINIRSITEYREFISRYME